MPLEQRGPAPEDYMKKVRVLILFLFTGLLLTSCLREAVPPLTEEASGETENAAPEQLPEEASPSGEETEAAPAGETEEASEKAPAEEVPAWAGMTFLLEDASLTVRLYGVSGKPIRLYAENNVVSFTDLREYTK